MRTRELQLTYKPKTIVQLH